VSERVENFSRFITLPLRKGLEFYLQVSLKIWSDKWWEQEQAIVKLAGFHSEQDSVVEDEMEICE
jgi:hypothetical protein